MTGTAVPSKRWLRHEPTGAAVHLLCIPHAGAGAASFTRWLGLFPPSVAAVRVQLPGREDATAEQPLRRVRDAVDGLLPEVRELGERVALYGHSMGALVAFELARALSGSGREPVHLFVSGRRAPHLPAEKASIHHLPESEFAAALEAMGIGTPHRGRALRRYVLPLIKADLELSEEYEHRPEPQLRCPITTFHGTGDPVVDANQLEAWRTRTTGPFAMHTFPGDHFFHQRHREAIAATMAKALE